MQPQLLGGALTAADRGWRVFPLRPGDKRPAVRDWQARATSDHARIRACWGTVPYNVGIACGSSGLVVLDLDVPKEATAAAGWTGELIRTGTDVLAAVAARAGHPYPCATYSVVTRSGGTHLYFAAPAGEPLRNTASRLGPLVDTRAAGGYVVAAGSVVDGQRYRVRTDWPVADLPGWIATALRPREDYAESAPHGSMHDIRHRSNYATAALRAEVDHVLKAEPGTRNHTLNAAAYSLGQLVGAGMLPGELTAAALTRAARTAGLRDSEIRATVRSGLTAGEQRPAHPARDRAHLTRRRPA